MCRMFVLKALKYHTFFLVQHRSTHRAQGCDFHSPIAAVMLQLKAKMTNPQKRYLSVRAELQLDAQRQLNSITASQPEGEVLNVQQDMVWVQVPCAVDSGACANVAPKDTFAEMPKDAPKLDSNLFLQIANSCRQHTFETVSKC